MSPGIPFISRFLAAHAIKSYNPVVALLDLKFCAVSSRGKQALSQRTDRGEQIKE
jgi:hypothetical protein